MSAGLSVLRPKPSLTQASADRLQSSVVPTAPRKIVFGLTAGGNDVRFEETYGSKNDNFARVVALASHRINAFQSYYVENDVCYANGFIQGTKAGGFNSFTPVLEGKSNNGFGVASGSYWTSTSTFTGCAYYSVSYKLGDAWPSGVSTETRAVIEGCPLYDPRRDSTRGGSGSHRWDDDSTFAYRDGDVELGRNPALALLTYLRGWRINGTLVWGMGIPVDRINLANFRTYANICEERVSLQDGSTVQRYTADGILSTADSHETNITAITNAMGSAKLCDVGGLYSLIGGYDDTLGPKQSFDENDLVARYSWQPAPSLRDSYNIIRGRFADPASLYQLSDWGEIDTDPLPDAVPRTMSLDLGMVSRAETCQRIAKQILLREAKTPGTFTATFGPRAFAVVVGSLCTLSLAEQGWNNKLFRVISQSETHDAILQMTLREESSEVYDWDREEKPLPTAIRPPPYDPTTTVSPSNLTLTTQSYAGANNIDVSEVTVHWTAETSGRVIGIQIESRPSGSTGWTEQAALHDPATGEFTFTSNAPGIAIEVRARFRMSNTGIFSPWVNASITTQAVIVRPDWSNVTGPNRPADNATNTRDPSAPFGGSLTVGQVITQVGGLQSTVNGLDPDAINAAKEAAQAAATAAQTAFNNANDAKADALTYKTAAETAASNSQTYRDQAATAKTDAQGFSATASQASQDAASARDTANGYASAANTSASTAITKAGEAGTSATNASTYAGQASTYAQNASTYAGNALNYSNAASGSAAAAQSSATLSASLGPGSLNTNPAFSDWPAGSGTPPTGWSWWDASQSIIRAVGINGRPYSAEFSCAANANGGIQQDINAAFGSFVIEITGRASDWQGTGILVYFLQSDLTTVVESVTINCAADADTSGYANRDGGGGGYTRTWSKFYKTNINGGIQRARIYVMANWDGFGERSAKGVYFDKVTIRPATAAEIAGQRADTNASSALASIGTINQTIVSNQQAIAGRVDTVEAKIPRGGNLLSNTVFADTNGWGTGGTGQQYGQFAINIAGSDWHPAGENAISIHQNVGASDGLYWFSDLIPISAGAWFQGSFLAAGHRCQLNLIVEHWDTPSSRYNAYTSDNGAFTPLIGGQNINNWQSFWMNDYARSNYIRLVMLKHGTNTGVSTDDSYAWFLRPQVCLVAGPTSSLVPYSPGTGLASTASALARVTTSEQAISTINGKVSAYWQVDAVAGNGRAQLRVHADQNGGGGVDIIGDVAINGGLVVNGTIATEKIAIGNVTTDRIANGNVTRMFLFSKSGQSFNEGGYTGTGGGGGGGVGGNQNL